MAAVSAASGFRTWMQSSRIPWLNPRRMRRLTTAAMSAAAIVSSLGFSGSTLPPAHAASAAQHQHATRQSTRR
jgi:hypothetical protein